MRDCNVPLTSDSDTTIKDKIFSICEYKLYNWLQKPYAEWCLEQFKTTHILTVNLHLVSEQRLFSLNWPFSWLLVRGSSWTCCCCPWKWLSGVETCHSFLPQGSASTMNSFPFLHSGRAWNDCARTDCVWLSSGREREKERTEWECENLSIDVSLQTCNHPINIIIACFYPIKKDVYT